MLHKFKTSLIQECTVDVTQYPKLTKVSKKLPKARPKLTSRKHTYINLHKKKKISLSCESKVGTDKMLSRQHWMTDAAHL